MERAAEAAFLALYVPDWFLVGAITLYVAAWQYTAQAVASFLGGLLNGVLN
jgi:hypothetical protein